MNNIKYLREKSGVDFGSGRFYLNNRLKEYLTEVVSKDCFVGGGFAVSSLTEFKVNETDRTVPYGDIDVFFQSESDYEEAVAYSKKFIGWRGTNDEYTYLGESLTATSVDVGGKRVQLIKTNFGPVEETLASFDFENCKAAMVMKKSGYLEFVFSDKLLDLIKNNQVLYRRQQNLHLPDQKAKENYARRNVDRLEKYIDRFSKPGARRFDPTMFVDRETQEELLLQYSWDLNQFFHKLPEYQRTSENKYRMLTQILRDKETTLEQAALFFPLGGIFKKLFEDKDRGKVNE